MPPFRVNLAVDANVLDLFLLHEVFIAIHYSLMMAEQQELCLGLEQRVQELDRATYLCLAREAVSSAEIAVAIVVEVVLHQIQCFIECGRLLTIDLHTEGIGIGII